MSSKSLRIIFMGTPKFAVETLKKLIAEGYDIPAVVTAPDKPAGRGKKLHEPDVKKFAGEAGIKHILQPEKLKKPEFIEELKNFNADLFIVVAFRMLPEVIWSMPRLGTINLHASLLPQYRGAAPINWAIINGETKTGVTTFFIEKEIDTGNIILQEELPIADTDNAGDIHNKLMMLGSELVIKTVKTISNGNFTPKSQDDFIDEKELKPAPKIYKEDCKIIWENELHRIYNHIRGLSPYPGAWSELTVDKQVLTFKIFSASAEKSDTGEALGTLVSDGKNYLKVAVTNGYINILELQLAGKKRLNIKDFLRGIQNVSDLKLVTSNQK